MKKGHVFLALALIGIFSVNECYAAWTLESMVKDLESKLPMAQKQAEVLVKMLNNEKHLTKIQGDIDILKDMKTCQLRAKDAYLYRVETT